MPPPALPAPLQEKMEGLFVYRCAPVFASGFPSLSSRFVAFSDAPGIYVFDSGGLLGQATVVELTGAELAGSTTAQWVDRSTVLIGQCWFPGDQSVGFRLVGEDALRVAREVLTPLAPPDGSPTFVQSIPVTVRCRFRLGRESLVAFLVDRAVDDELLRAAVTPILAKAPEPRPPDSCVGLVFQRIRKLPDVRRSLIEHVYCDELGATVLIDGGRLLLQRGERGGIASIPCRQLLLTVDEQDERIVRLAGDVIVAGQEVEEIAIAFPEVDAAHGFQRSFAAATGHKEEAIRGHTGLVELTGVVDGSEVVDVRADAVLATDALELRDAGTGQLIHRFEFAGEQTALQGTSTSFVIADGRAGPVVIRPTSMSFQRRLASHRRVAEAARRSADQGPFVGFLDGGPVVLRIGEEQVTLAGPGAPLPIAIAHISGLDLRTDERTSQLAIETAERTLLFEAELDMLEGAANHLRAAHLVQAGAERIPVLCEAIAALERDWFLHTAFGPLVDAHRHLGEALETDSPREAHQPLPSPTDAQEQMLVLTWFAEGLGYLRHHLDLVVHALPGFTVRQDEALLEQAGLLPVAGDPEVYRQALHPLAGVLPHLERIDQEISQLDWLRKALLSSQTGYAGVALKLGASLINPFGLVGAAREAYRVRTLQGRIAATETQGAADAAQRCVAEWNHLATQLLPVLGPAVERALLPARRTLTSHLLQAWEDAEDAERLLRALALRFARLENYRRFPPDGLDPTPRSSAIALLRRIRQEAPPLPFKPF